MNILIITTYYPPDTAIAAVRPYMFAKYLNKYGHNVTVMRSGLLQQSADRSFKSDSNVRVITYLGENSIARRFERGENDFLEYSHKSGDSRISFLPEPARKVFAKIYHTIISPYDFYRWMKKDYIDGRVTPMKKAIDSISNEHFDIVFSTYGAVENIIGGEYAAKVFNAKWFLDFRDPIEPHAPNAFGIPFLKRIQRNAIKKADICTAVSDDLASYLSTQAGGKNVYTLYNGYDPEIVESFHQTTTDTDKLSFCYTGQLYNGRRDASALFNALRILIDEGKIDQTKIVIRYAGRGFDLFKQQASKYNMESVLVDYGYVNRTESAQLQASSDIFLVLSWNTRKEKGVLTGKLYEGIRCQKPILSLICGNVPNSELNRINKKYNYGFCFEDSMSDIYFEQLCQYIEKAYKNKCDSLNVPYDPSPGLFSDFRYDTLAKKFEKICFNLLKIQDN